MKQPDVPSLWNPLERNVKVLSFRFLELGNDLEEDIVRLWNTYFHYSFQFRENQQQSFITIVCLQLEDLNNESGVLYELFLVWIMLIFILSSFLKNVYHCGNVTHFIYMYLNIFHICTWKVTTIVKLTYDLHYMI